MAFLAAASLLTGACGSSSKKGSQTPTTVDTVAGAQARVATAQTNEANAQTALTAANQQFCAAAKDYVSALDRYGKIFDDSKATVGDVKTAGADLPAPRATVETAIDGVSTARTDHARAQKELAEANAALAAAKASASGSSTSPSSAAPPTTTTTIVPPATVDRVKRAESDFAKNTATVSDTTSVAEAGVVFNSAAFALEAAWLQLLAQAGCVSEDQQARAIENVRDYTVALQNELQLAGYYTGAKDGIYGPETVDAVKLLQTDSKLPITGLVDKATAIALDKKVDAVSTNAASQSLVEIASLQSVLKVAGYWTGPVDGKWTPELTDALKKMQSALGVPATGVVDPATLSALESTVATAKATSTTTTPTSSTTGG